MATNLTGPIPTVKTVTATELLLQMGLVFSLAARDGDRDRVHAHGYRFLRQGLMIAADNPDPAEVYASVWLDYRYALDNVVSDDMLDDSPWIAEVERVFDGQVLLSQRILDALFAPVVI